MAKVFFDTEFTGLRQNTTLVSIGCVSEDGSEFYAELTDHDKGQVDTWLQDNVIDNLYLAPSAGNQWGVEMHRPPLTTAKGATDYVKMCLESWLNNFSEVQMVSDCLAYDWVLFCDLWGSALDVPSNISPAPRDINQDIAGYLGINEKLAFDIHREEFANMSDAGQKHNALWDARVIKACYERVTA